MAEKRYVVPEGMRKAAGAATNGEDPDGYCLYRPLEAAIKWLAENPIVPTPEQLTGLTAKWNDGQGTFLPYEMAARAIAIDWQRRMFLAPEPPRIPKGIEEAFAERLRLMQFGGDPRRQELLELFADIYRRGLDDGARKPEDQWPSSNQYAR